MITGMPQYAQAPIENYLETGNFKNHKKEMLPDTMDSKEALEEFRGAMDEFVSFDNVEGFDNDPRAGYLDIDSFFNIKGGYKKGEDGTREMFQIFGNDQESAVIYSRDTGDVLDMVTVSNIGSAEEGVQHYDAMNPKKSFMTFAPEQ